MGQHGTASFVARKGLARHEQMPYQVERPGEEAHLNRGPMSAPAPVFRIKQAQSLSRINSMGLLMVRFSPN